MEEYSTRELSKLSPASTGASVAVSPPVPAGALLAAEDPEPPPQADMESKRDIQSKIVKIFFIINSPS